MTDIVERIRHRKTADACRELKDESADIIELLRARVAELEALMTTTGIQKAQDQFNSLRDELAALKAGQGEPVGKIVAATGSLSDAAIIQWTGSYRPMIGDLLYTESVTIPEIPQICRRYERQIAELRSRYREVSKAAHELAASLVLLRTEETRGIEMLRRERVMELVTGWRSKWDTAVKWGENDYKPDESVENK